MLAITVDEVHQRRKSLDASNEDIHGIWPQTTAGDTSSHDRGGSSSSSVASAGSYSLDDAKPLPAKTAPIVEEDEDQLFPLPSPRRSPNASPKPSPFQSPSISSVPSPNAATSSLRPSPLSSQFRSSSHDSLPSAFGSTSDESSSETKDITRKIRYQNDLLIPDASPSILHHVPSTFPLQH